MKDLLLNFQVYNLEKHLNQYFSKLFEKVLNVYKPLKMSQLGSKIAPHLTCDCINVWWKLIVYLSQGYFEKKCMNALLKPI